MTDSVLPARTREQENVNLIKVDDTPGWPQAKANDSIITM